ncbi:3-isopropylmalate dehydratase small subunit [Candidatus Aerophobetes bacterium Ae_b3b]|nr:3-isopropylmalate dehydratase small subunit [Candidatus Aerophobetes bacterium]TKJ45739.1 MAG: 3-isopropylmalate dehydratase small subunit [Candidatus Aerophobetes bacterium Ae_b3b]
MKIEGRALKYGDNINTDEIIPGVYLNITDGKELAKHCMEPIDKDFLRKVKERNILVAGKNFGCGSSREHAPIALKGAGVSFIIAASFARIFFRNALNIGLPIVECREAAQGIRDNDRLIIDWVEGKIQNLAKKESYSVAPFPPFLQELIRQGGLEKYIKNRMRQKKNA